MSAQHLYTLIKKYRKRQCTPLEKEELDRWYEQFNQEAECISDVPDEKLEILLFQIKNNIETRKSQNYILKRRLSRLSQIAAVLMIGIVGGWFYGNRVKELPPIESHRLTPIVPGHRHAELTLADGSKIALDSSVVVKEEEGSLIKTASSPVLDYSSVTKERQEIVYNTISVPYGGEYRLILADGTEVWLNSGSSLKYPVVFRGEKREVILEGEAYFDVTKSAIPFIVKTFDLEIQVLGTSFNMSAYGNDDLVMTTLVEGRVKVVNNHDDQQYEIKPGHILTYSKRMDQMMLEVCDTDVYTSWIKGKFKFRDMRLEDIMKKLNRWYDCQVEFKEAQLKELRFSGAAEKDHPIEYVLEMIRAVTEVDFEIDKTTILVKSR